MNNPGGAVIVESAEMIGDAPRLKARQEMRSLRDSRVDAERDILMVAPDFVWVRDSWKNQGPADGFAGSLWHGKGAALGGKSTGKFASGLRVSVDGKDSLTLSDRISYGMKDQPVLFTKSPLPAGASQIEDFFLFPKGEPGNWHQAAATGDAMVWTDGTRTAGRNPSGRKIAAEGIETDARLFIMTKKNGRISGAWLNGTVVALNGTALWQSATPASGELP